MRRTRSPYARAATAAPPMSVVNCETPHGVTPKAKDHELSIAGLSVAGVHRSKSAPPMSGQGLGCVKTQALAPLQDAS